jgi:hypothetical protein
MSRTVLFCLIAGFDSFCPRAAYSQTTFLDALTSHLTVSQSLTDKNTLDEAAFATVTMPDGEEDHNVVAVAAEWKKVRAEENPKFNWGPSFQFNQNSLASHRQNLFQAVGSIDARTGGKDTDKPFFFYRVHGAGGYKHNGEDHANGATATAYLTYEKYRKTETEGAALKSSAIPFFNGVLEFAPQIGVEFDDVMRASDPAAEGRTTRAMASGVVNAYPVPGPLVLLSAAIAYRRDVQTDFAGSRNHTYGRLSATVFLDSNKIFSISLDRVMGDEPKQGFSGPDYTSVALKIHFAKPQKRALIQRRATGLGAGLPNPII